MKISYKWLKDLLSFDVSADEVSRCLTNCGLEVEGVETFDTIRGGLRGLVIGEVLTCEPHPNSDHLHVTTVNIGQGEPLHVVCGAANVAAGQKVVVATIGTTLYNGDESFTIKKSKLRGEPSEGMICAEDEIGLGASHDGIMVLDPAAVPGTPAAEYFNVESDTIFEIGLTPNRCDAICHTGVAIDLYAALVQAGHNCSPLILPTAPEVKSIANVRFSIDVTVENTKDCPRYSWMVLDNVTVGESPLWLQNRLRALGIRPINNVVDITQYIMLELGQPMHAFDADKIQGNRVIVKNLPEGTPFVTLDGNELKLNAADLMVCNEKEGMCIAGVYGGLNSGITGKTTRVFLESAYFNPVSIRRTSKRHGLKTDASFRYERGCNPDITVYALKRAADLMVKFAGAVPISDITDNYPYKIEPAQITLTYDQINKVAGQEIERQTVTKILSMLGMEIQNTGGDRLLVRVPLSKADVTRPIDLIEEILRIYGYNRIGISDILSYKMPTGQDTVNTHALRLTMSTYLADNGFFEVMNNSLTKSEYAAQFGFIDETQTIKLLNPLSNELNVMRQSLLFGGMENVVRNINNKNANLRLFEFGKTYWLDTTAAHEEDVTVRYREKDGFVMFVTGKDSEDSWNHKAADLDLFYLRNMTENLLSKVNFPTDKLTLTTEGEPRMFSDFVSYRYENEEIAVAGQLSAAVLKYFDLKKPVCYAEFNLAAIKRVVTGQTIQYKGINVYPAVKRDLALVVDRDVTFETLKHIGLKYGSKLVKRISLFDVFEGEKIGEGKKSYALNFVLQNPDKTLTEEEISKLMKKLIAAYEREAGAILR